MTYKAIVEDTEAQGYTATALGLPNCTASGATKDEAVARLRQTMKDRLSKAEVVSIEVDVPANGHPLARFAGMFEDDSLFDQFLEDMAAYRRDVDAETTE